jgi:hypothetical protein
MTKNKPEFRKLATKEVCELLDSLQKKGAKLSEHYVKYGSLCYGMPEEDFLQLPLSDSEVAFEHITETLKKFN